jgi:hypothetical protein
MSDMRCHSKILKLLATAILNMTVIFQSAIAEPVWHCSRSDIQIANSSDDFTLAALTVDREVIRISLRDLYNVYQDNLVRLSGDLPLSACLITGNASLTNAALQSIGAQPSVVKALASHTNLSKTNIYMVKDEASMRHCIAKNHPAIGYLSRITYTEAVGPCF